MIIVRDGGPADLEPVLTIADQRRQRYAEYQRQFWNPAADAVERQRSYFRALLEDTDVLFAVSGAVGEVSGFVIARLVPTPPVYDPGGATCLVDDFAVQGDDDWPTAGAALLARVRSWAAEHGAAQLVVVTARLDAAKREALDSAGLTPASEWWVGPVEG